MFSERDVQMPKRHSHTSA